MHRYTVVKITKIKENDIGELFEIIKPYTKKSQIFFEAARIKTEKGIKKSVWRDFDWKKYYHIYEFAHMKDISYVEKSDKQIELCSNLSEIWEWSNPMQTQSLSIEEASLLIQRMNHMGLQDCGTFLIGFDGIEWKENCSITGTYGYEKCRSYDYYGSNFLSNGIIFAKDCLCHKYIILVSYEESCADSEILRNVIQQIGEVEEEQSYYAPENAEERMEWTLCYEEKKQVFEKMKTGLPELYGGLPYQLGQYNPMQSTSSEIIPVKKILKKVLEPKGWSWRKNKVGEKGIRFEKNIGDGTIIIWIDSLQKGHYLQMFVQYVGIQYFFTDYIMYSYVLEDCAAVEKYCSNVGVIASYIEDVLGTGR